MKSKTILTVTAQCLLACLCWQAIPAQCADLFFNYSTAQRLYIDLTYSQRDAANKGNRLSLCDSDRELLVKQTGLLAQKITGLQQDKDAYRTESEQFKGLYVAADEQRVAAENNAPSRVRWFAAGAVAVLIGITALFIMK